MKREGNITIWSTVAAVMLMHHDRIPWQNMSGCLFHIVTGLVFLCGFTRQDSSGMINYIDIFQSQGLAARNGKSSCQIGERDQKHTCALRFRLFMPGLCQVRFQMVDLLLEDAWRSQILKAITMPTRMMDDGVFFGGSPIMPEPNQIGSLGARSRLSASTISR